MKRAHYAKVLNWALFCKAFTRDHLFLYVRKIFPKTMCLSGGKKCAYQGVRNVSFSENFAYVLNEWSSWNLPTLVGGVFPIEFSF